MSYIHGSSIYGTMNIVGGAISSIYGTISIVGGNPSSIGETMISGHKVVEQYKEP